MFRLTALSALVGSASATTTAAVPPPPRPRPMNTAAGVPAVQAEVIVEESTTHTAPIVTTTRAPPPPPPKTTTKTVTVTATTTTPDAVATTVEAATLSDGLYVLKYPQQACAWSSFTEGEDWQMYSSSDDAGLCATSCVATEGCTGFEVGSDSGSEFGDGPYCAFWMNGACSVPTDSFDGAFSLSTGDFISVDTYTLTLPIDAFIEYESSGCAWSSFTQGQDWDFATTESDDASDCAVICLEAANDEDTPCTGFEVGSSESTEFGDLSQGYCALWFNDNCGSGEEMLHHVSGASTYTMIGTKVGYEYDHTHFFYIALLVAALLACVGVCCCCRRAMIRRRLAMQRAAAARLAVRAPGAAAIVPVTVAGVSGKDRAVVYAVQVQDQCEPSKH